MAMFALLESEPKKKLSSVFVFFCSAIIFIEEGSVHITMTVCMKIENYYRAHHYKCVIFQCVLYKHHNKNPYHQITHIACYYEEDDDDSHDDDDYGRHDKFLLWSFYR